PQLLRSAELGFLNGHVPVTGILSAIAVLAAVLTGRDAVVMSNEWSASIPTLEFDGRPVNHQFSKSEEFESAFRGVLAGGRAPVLLAARRDDRAGDALLQELAAEVTGWPDAPSEAEIAAMLRPVGRNFIPDQYR